MSKLNVKNGTPVGNEHLCRTCSHGQYMTGYRESEVLVVCGNLNPAMVVPFPVYECTDYWDRNRPSWDEMKKFALNLTEECRKPTPGFRQKGFSIVPVPAPNRDEDDDEGGEAARLRAQLKLIRKHCRWRRQRILRLISGRSQVRFLPGVKAPVAQW